MAESRYDAARETMVRTQIVSRGIACERVLEAIRRVPRHAFVPEASWEVAYTDHPLAIGCGQTISQPYMVAVMTELLALTGEETVLEIGTGSGYQAAILSVLARRVVTVERHAELAEKARERLTRLGYANVSVKVGDGTLGWPEEAPYDAILVTAGAPCTPPSLLTQLALGGRLECPSGDRKVQQLEVYRRTETGLARGESIRCVFVPLIGAEGWREGTV